MYEYRGKIVFACAREDYSHQCRERQVPVHAEINVHTSYLRASLPCGQGPCKGAARDAWDRHGVGARRVIDNIETVY